MVEETLRIATFNIGSLKNREDGLVTWLSKEDKKIDICALQETKKIGRGEETIGKYALYYSGADKGVNGVAIAVALRIDECVEKIYFISDRIIFITAVFDKVRVHFFSVYTPTSSKAKDIELNKSYFWKQLSDILSVLPKDDKIYLMGDFNSRVGINNELYETCQGEFGFGNRNEEGYRLLEFAKSWDLELCNTKRKKEDDSKNITYSCESQIDFILTRLNNTDSVMECGVEEPFFEESHHKPVVAKIKITFSKPAVDPKTKYGTSKLRNNKRTRADYIHFPLSAENADSEKKINAVLNGSDWIGFLEKIKGPRADIDLNLSQNECEVINEVKNIVTEDPLSFLDSEQKIDRFNEITSRETAPSKEEEKELIVHNDEENYRELSLDDVKNGIIHYTTKEPNIIHHTKQETEDYLRIRNELHKTEDAEYLQTLFNTWLQKKAIPEEYTRKIIVPTTDFYFEINRYAIEIFDCILYLKLRKIVKVGAKNWELFYNEGLLCVQENIIRRLTQEKKFSFISLVFRTDSFPRKLLSNLLLSNEVSEELSNTILLTYPAKQTYSNGSIKEQIVFPLRRASPLSRLILALAIQYSTKNLKKGPPKILGFSDRVILLASTRTDMQDLVNEWNTAFPTLSDASLTINVAKSTDWTKDYKNNINVGRLPIRKSTDLFHINQVFDLIESPEVDTIRSINAAWDKWASLSFILRNKEISFSGRCKIYTKIIRPIAVRGAQGVKLNAAQVKAYAIMEEKMLRYMNIDIKRYKYTPSTLLKEIKAIGILDSIDEKIVNDFKNFYLPGKEKEIANVDWLQSLKNFAANAIDISDYLAQDSQ